MRVPFIDSSKIFTEHEEEYIEAFRRVGREGAFTLGDRSKDIYELEKWFAEFIGVKHAILVGSGTQALKLAYKALGIGPGDEVITTAHTFSSTFDQVVAVGATPVLVDIDETGLIDPKEIEKAITPKTKAIVPVHLEGKVAEMEEIMMIAVKHGLKVIEDSAQAISASYFMPIGGEIKAGSIGDLGCFSLYWAKIFGTFGNLGMVTTNDDELAYRVSNLRANYRFEKDPEKIDYGFNDEPDNAWAAVLNVRKKYLPDYLKRRAEVAGMYDEGLKDLPIKIPLKQKGRVYQDYVIRVSVLDKPHLLKYLEENGVGFLGHDVPYYPDYPKLNLKFDLPKTREYIAEQIRIPCNPYLKNEEVEYVIKVIRAFYDTK